MSDTMELFGSTLNEIANGPRVTGHLELTEALMRRLAEKGLSLEQLSDRRMMKRSLSTLQKYAHQFDLSFPDYVPMKLRPKKDKAHA